MQGTWIDVGAHHGDASLWQAQQNPGLKVYAFEPDLRAAALLIGRAANFVVIPMAVAESDGQGQFHLNRFAPASSMLPMDEDARNAWIGGQTLEVETVITVATIRLDTFLNLLRISAVDFLKIDTQGMDLAVVRSAGSRLRDIHKVVMEVDLSPKPLYRGAPSKNEVCEFMKFAGFKLVSAESQSDRQEENLTFERS
jgi:FkbM family methyltransferase